MTFKSILITGGTGFFGHGFVRELLRQNLSYRICIYSRDEYKQALMRAALGDDPRLRFFIGCIRDADRLEEAMQGVDVVVHAAALKRIEVGFYNPEEMFKTNMLGTINVIRAAKRAGVGKVVGLSSDKAFQGASAYGLSKAAAECLMLSANHTRGSSGPIYACVRYGNVFRSTGSIVPKWESMREAGVMEVPVTDPDCTRFFMKLEEAVQLVLDTVMTMRGGELAIPDLPAYRVGDLAEAMGMQIRVVGLPEFEKMHESMDSSRCSKDARRMSVSELQEELCRIL